MLFGGFDRFSAFAPSRLKEAMAAGIFSEVILVVNIVDDDEILRIRATSKDLEGVFTLAFNAENNIPGGRNIGISLTHGDSVFIWDDDDALVNSYALSEAFRFFSENDLPIMEVPMVFPDVSLFHPGEPEIMPQIDSGLKDLVLIGMMHTPFFLKKEVWRQVPMPEYVPLRGDWLHWSALIWEAGIPITCWTKYPVMVEGVRSRSNGLTASGNGHGATLQAYTSLITLFAIYCQMTGEDKESVLVRKRYFDKYCTDEQTWRALVVAGRALEEDIPGNAIVSQAQQIVRQRLSGVRFENKSLKPYQAVMEPEIAKEIFAAIFEEKCQT